MAAVALTGKAANAAGARSRLRAYGNRTRSTDFPELVVEWLPAEGPATADGIWADISAYVASCTIARGRQYELDRFQAGTCELVLRTPTRLFDPDNTASIYTGNLVPMRQLRINAVWNNVWYPVFRGYITDWGNTTPQDVLFETTVTAKDAFVRLEQQKLPSSAWALEVQYDDPTCWFRLGETDTLRMSDSSDGGHYGLYADRAIPGAQGLVANDADGAAQFDHSPDTRCPIFGTPITGYPFTFLGMFQLNADDLAAEHTIVWFAKLGPPGNPRFNVRVTGTTADPAAGNFAFEISDGTSLGMLTTEAVLNDGEPHFFVIVVPEADATTWKVYIDGALAATTLTTSGVSGSPAWPAILYWCLGNLPDIFASYGSFGFGNGIGPDGTTTNVVKGILDEITFYDGQALTADRIAALSLAAKTGWVGDLSGVRVARLLDRIDWPTELRDLDQGISTLNTAKWSAGTTVLSVVQSWADSEIAWFFVDREGRIVWRSRHAPYLNANMTTSQATFTDGRSAGLVYLDDGFSMQRDETLIRNPIQAGRRDGVTVTVKDQTYVDKYGDRTWAAPTSEEEFDAAMRDRATWFLAQYKELTTRLQAMVVAPRRDPTNLWPAVLDLEIGDRITVKRTPLGLNAETSVAQLVQQIKHTFSPTAWVTEIGGSPAPTDINTYLILDDATYGLLDSFRLAY